MSGRAGGDVPACARKPTQTGRALVLVLGALLAGGGLPGCGGTNRTPRPRVAPEFRADAFTSPLRVRLGHSVDRRPIDALEVRGAAPRRTLLVFGCIHGNERAGIAVAQRLASLPAVAGIDLWIVPDLNPDGAHADARVNAHKVDLNRNFPFAWRPLGVPGDLQYSGPRPLSEPESDIARRLILRLRPSITIWFHQPLGLVDESGGSLGVELRFSRLAGLPLRRLMRYPGSATSWQNHALRPTTAFVVELPPGRLDTAGVGRLATAVRRLA